ncbi:hypothetical protein CPB85DRAFT_1372403 [Mucidula mucida]|nr:hypothetical protein CPB85DRAFT_1372403 [Mucidula mucida]
MRSLLRPLRGLHSSASLWHLVGPPNPISHIRPIIYDDVPPPPPPSRLQHPYSLAEFDPAPPAGSTVHDIQWRLQRHEIDKLDESFWHDSNIRFESGKEAVLASLPPTASALDRENALSEFYKQPDKCYTLEWRARNLSCITEAARAMLSKFGKKLTFQ